MADRDQAILEHDETLICHMHYRLRTLLILLCMAGCSAAAPNPSQLSAEDELPRVVVPLLGSTRDVRGMKLPDEVHEERVGGADLLEPHLLTVRLSNGRELTVPVRSMSF